jgi:hypothetical protein
VDFQYCPKCEAFNPPGATHCEQCQAELPAEDLAPRETAPEGEGAAPVIEEVAAEPPMAEPPVPQAPAPQTPAQPAGPPSLPAPFDASPEILERVQQLEAEIQKKPNANALYLQLSQLYLDGKRKDLASRALERCLERDPKNVYMRHRLEQLTGIGPARAAAPVPGATAGRPLPPSARTATPLRPVHRHAVRRRRTPRWAVAAGVAGLLALALAIKLLFFPAPELLVAGTFSASAPKWSPTGRQFAFVKAGGERNRLCVYDLKRGKHRELADLAGGDASAFAWSPDGSRIAYVGLDEKGWGEAVFVVEVERGQPRLVAGGHMPAWAPDGTTLLMWCAGRNEVEQVASPVIGEDGQVFDPGEVRYTVREPAGICRVNAETGEVLRRMPESEDSPLGWGAEVSALLGKVVFERAADEQPAPPPSRSGDGEFVDMVDSVAARGARNLAEGSRDLSRELEARQRDSKRAKAASGYRRDVYVADLDGGPARALTTDGHSGSPVWTPDGERILFAGDGGLWLMNADGSGRQQAFKGRLAQPPAAQLTADGRYVLFVAPVEANEGVAKLMTGESPEDLHVARVGSSSARRLANRHPFKQRFALSPDGRRIVYEVVADPGTLTRRGGRTELWMMSR